MRADLVRVENVTVDDAWPPTMIDALRYDGRRVVVTGGGGRSMGAAVARAVRELGGEVHVLDVQEPVDEVDGFVHADLSSPDAIDAALHEVGGPIDSLFNVVGVIETRGPDHVMAVDFLGVRHLTHRVLDGLMSAGGTIGCVSSRSAWRWREHQHAVRPLVDTPDFASGAEWARAHATLLTSLGGSYAVAKIAMIVWSLQLSTEIGSRGIRVNCTLPGTTRTPGLIEFERAGGREMIDRTPVSLACDAQPYEQAFPLVFLNSHAAGYVTGVDLACDGGTMGGLAVGVFDMTARTSWKDEHGDLPAPTTPTLNTPTLTKQE